MTALAESPAGLFAGHEVPLGLYLNGEWTHPGKTFEVLNPSTGKPLAEVADGGPDHALAALGHAVAAQDAWRHWSPRERATLFHRAHAMLVERADAFADVMVLESGKPRAEAAGEFALSAGFFLWYAEQIAHLHGTYAPGSPGGYRVVTTHQPVGPSFLVTPWNFPLLMVARKGGAALAAGCTVVVKSAKETPLTAALFIRTLHDAGFPPGVVNLVHTSDSAAVSDVVLADPRLRKISFTGSTGVGSLLLAKAAQHIVNSSMELGGDGPFVVLDDADVDLAVREAIACKFRNAGQACVAANRIILHRAIADEFTEKFVAATRALRVGDGFEDGVDVGPIITPLQLERVQSLVDTFTAAGAELLAGGNRIESAGNFFEPTVLRLREADPALCNQELFAPVAALFTVDSARQALDFANDTTYGLASYLFTKDLSRAFAIAERLDFGMVGINRGIMADPAAAFGGVKESGLGREGGHDGIYEFLEPKYLAVTVNEEEVGA
ncbi:NAD-dependent succinate-semialdehyde dehydrogenase [Amycolatopsis sp. DSM 110486]|uniref:NAD-dependent succinate-semialdehyde dehydrogenase n=1 Tax=Amycolatopsis sp. DSM 110486 TaxID=2865832 RepID=UPI001C69FA47|nr:NAD-dependent succinate-semialdehyde dehydrogenase [Amycolatopsis sp. DSM 110486]QYN19941.1 NAD-dependent succinate-semialdehyde dehydrogenase [Amycolatopsis sp. DSM 110486]